MNARVLAYLQLFRLPNVFSAAADVLMGFFFVQASFQPLPSLLLLICASCLLYTAGMVLNDVFDFEVDQVQRPQRPLPSGRIDRAWASKLGIGMLGLGVLCAVLVGPTSGGVAGILAVSVYVYDGVTKKTVVAPLVMGSCRLLNVLLGMSLAPQLLQTPHLLIAGGLGLYVAGITWFARSEARVSDRRLLIFGAAVMFAGIVVLGCLSWFSPDTLQLRGPQGVSPELLWPACLALIMVSVGRRCAIAIAQPQPANVQHAVKHALRSLVVLDAAIVLGFVGPLLAIFVLALLAPSLLLGRWIYST